MRRLLCALFFLALSTPLYAQTHYCDTVAPTSGTSVVGSTVTIQACHDGKDATGTVTIAPTGFRIYDNNVGANIAMTKGTTSTVSGKALYTGSYVVPGTPGTHALQTTALVGTSESTRSNTFTLTGTAAVPSAPTNLSVP